MKVTINDVRLKIDYDYTVVGRTIVMKWSPEEGSTVIIERETATDCLNQWEDASVLSAKDLTMFNKHLLHIVEELHGAITLDNDVDGGDENEGGSGGDTIIDPDDEIINDSDTSGDSLFIPDNPQGVVWASVGLERDFDVYTGCSYDNSAVANVVNSPTTSIPANRGYYVACRRSISSSNTYYIMGLKGDSTLDNKQSILLKYTHTDKKICVVDAAGVVLCSALLDISKPTINAYYRHFEMFVTRSVTNGTIKVWLNSELVLDYKGQTGGSDTDNFHTVLFNANAGHTSWCKDMIVACSRIGNIKIAYNTIKEASNVSGVWRGEDHVIPYGASTGYTTTNKVYFIDEPAAKGTIIKDIEIYPRMTDIDHKCAIYFYTVIRVGGFVCKLGRFLDAFLFTKSGKTSIPFGYTLEQGECLAVIVYAGSMYVYSSARAIKCSTLDAAGILLNPNDPFEIISNNASSPFGRYTYTESPDGLTKGEPIVSAQANKAQMYSLNQSVTFSNKVIRGVMLNSNLEGDSYTKVTPVIKVGGRNDEGAFRSTVPTSSQLRRDYMANSPFTTKNWTVNEINSMQMGVKIVES